MMKHRLFLSLILVLSVGFFAQAQDLDDPISCDDVDAQSLEVYDLLIVECDEDCAGGSIWGTGAYTSDSDVCTAAAHAGVIDAEEGGLFILFVVPGLDNYVGSELNGIESSDWSSGWETSLTFEPMPLQLGWADTALSIDGEAGTAFSAICLEDEELYTVWGTGIYTDDSSICTAALHFDIDVEDIFYVSILDGQDEYEGTESNDVETLDYGSWGRSYTIAPSVIPIEWSTSLDDIGAPIGTTFAVSCEAEGDVSSLWGTDVYSGDSSICTAAVHNGTITLANGGSFFVSVLEGQDEYEESEQNGVTSSEWDEWDTSFVVGYWTQDRDEE